MSAKRTTTLSCCWTSQVSYISRYLFRSHCPQRLAEGKISARRTDLFTLLEAKKSVFQAHKVICLSCIEMMGRRSAIRRMRSHAGAWEREINGKLLFFLGLMKKLVFRWHSCWQQANLISHCITFDKAIQET